MLQPDPVQEERVRRLFLFFSVFKKLRRASVLDSFPRNRLSVLSQTPT